MATNAAFEPYEYKEGGEVVGIDADIANAICEKLGCKLVIDDMDFDALDFNLGCPAPKVARKCEGIRFAMENPDGAVRALETLVSASRLPVTAKTRIQDENDPAPTVACCRRLRAAPPRQPSGQPSREPCAPRTTRLPPHTNRRPTGRTARSPRS